LIFMAACSIYSSISNVRLNQQVRDGMSAHVMEIPLARFTFNWWRAWLGCSSRGATLRIGKSAWKHMFRKDERHVRVKLGIHHRAAEQT
jgi:hypothetical protein